MATVSAAEAANDALLREAIGGKRLIAFRYDGLPRTGEPHDYGVEKGALRVLVFQVAGESRSGRPMDWRLFSTARMTDLQVLDTRFAGTRATPTGRHRRGDRIIASVTLRPTPA